MIQPEKRFCENVSVCLFAFFYSVSTLTLFLIQQKMCSYMVWMFSFSCKRKLRRCWLLHERCILFRHVQSVFHPQHAQLCPVDVFQFAVSTTSSQFSLCVSFAHCQLAASWNLTFDIFKVCVTTEARSRFHAAWDVHIISCHTNLSKHMQWCELPVCQSALMTWQVLSV